MFALNIHRCKHCSTPALQWDASLAAQAQSRADSCPASRAAPSGLTDAVEVVSFLQVPIRTESFFNWNAVVTTWHSSGNAYNFDTGHGGGFLGDFFPLVWDTTTHVGCGYNPSCSNALPTGALHLTAVCRFSPAPEGQSTAHVFPLAQSSSCSQSPSCQMTG